MAPVSDDQLLAEVEDLLRAMPTLASMQAGGDTVVAWMGRADSLLYRWDSAHAMETRSLHRAFDHLGFHARASTHTGYARLLQHAKHDLRMKTTGPLTQVIPEGQVHSYFEAIRRVIESAKFELLFVDRYLDPSFVDRYLPSVPSGVAVRLLGKQKPEALKAAAELFAAQHGIALTARIAGDEIHDRWIFVDGTEGYLSGASFKDGGKNSSSVVIQVADSFPTVFELYERIWANARVLL